MDRFRQIDSYAATDKKDSSPGRDLYRCAGAKV